MCFFSCLPDVLELLSQPVGFIAEGIFPYVAVDSEWLWVEVSLGELQGSVLITMVYPVHLVYNLLNKYLLYELRNKFPYNYT